MHYKTLLPHYLKGLSDGIYTYQQASESTGYSVSWLWSLHQRYKTEGLSVLNHKNKGKAPANKTSPAIINKVLGLYKSYSGVNFAYFADCLQRYNKINISASTVARILRKAGYVSPEAHKAPKKTPQRRPRERRKNFGDLLQIDGTPFRWFQKFGNSKRYDLMGMIDDATGQITGLYMCDNECIYGYIECLKQTTAKHGIPREVYSDRAAIFCVTPKNKKNLTQWEELQGLHSRKTQWQRILEDLSIRQILAWSPEAKGRVERMWRTIQGQLPQWLWLHGAKTVQQANAILPQYIAEFNSKYKVEPRKDITFFRSAPKDIDDILQVKLTRQTDSVGVFSFHSYKFALHAPRAGHRQFTLCITDKGLRGYLDNQYWPVELLEDILVDRTGTMTEVLEDIIYRYMYANQKLVSA